ncbi:HAD-IC family P-type ATPase [Ramlibacter sp. XY19]|uniref:cation-translocating P-type ATPase n=1 Tax=Ramlibacter paludis TaxID=2908000 RepID=UPI0023DC219F|nr:HAD-IC family P-type ATPase [Ramlibacter paludis]MCG2594396.1 HAD-IC family P-type ATPase [Ramlibacter paludis]
MNSAAQGLTTDEARERLARFGRNESAEARDHSLRHVLAAVAGEPMFLLLLAAAALYLAIGDLGEGLLLSFFAVVSVGLVMLQQYRGERALQALRELAVRHVRVLRDGATVRMPATELVPGDWMLVGEGERIGADALLREASALQVDESLLTGESAPVRKRTGPAAGEPVPGGDDSPHVFAGTLVVGGHGVAEVTGTGARTQMGRIGGSLAGIETQATPLQRQVGRLVRWFGVLALALSAALVLWYGLRSGDWLQGVLAALAFAMAMLPEEIPMVLAIFIGLAGWRMARLQVLARRPAVIEALGAATVLCVDKTGTLTENRQRLRRLASGGADLDLTAGDALPPSARSLLEYAVLASRRGSADPLDQALLAEGDARLAAPQLHADWELCREYALTPELPAMSHAWRRPEGSIELAAKGAVEAIADLCRLAPAPRAALLREAEALAGQGLRVLAVARGSAVAAGLAAQQQDLPLDLLGLVAFEDPLRAGVPAAVAEARAAGIAVVMITGDHVATALAIAAQAGIPVGAGALTGAELARMDAQALRAAVRDVRVFARVLPQQKLALVQALQANGETVVMTGDGVNDAPALKAAHIGIAMGRRGTDVAREAAGLVLLDEDFARIVAGVRAGRRTFDNLRHAMTYIVAVHVPIAGLALLPLLFGLPPILLPAHVVLTEMVIDPMCSFAFEGVAEQDGLMRRPPRPAREALLGRTMLRQGVLEGGLLLAVVLAVYAGALQALDAEQARTLAVVGLTAGNLMLVWVNTGPHGRRQPAQRALFWITGGAALALGAAIAWPPLRSLLQFGVPPAPAAAADTGKHHEDPARSRP